LALDDARFKLDKIHIIEMVERQGAPGPLCFGARIMGEPVPQYFQLARGTRTYNSSTKPKDWLEDYATAVNCNSCEGVVETQAIMWFAQGCRYVTICGKDSREICWPHWSRQSR
jgi:hypothetical protein